ncbi:MAG: hypothetical protein ABL933_17770 [Methyloglobulus sp.]|nr:hypothetical protein [Methyloglobulus sp.]
MAFLSKLGLRRISKSFKNVAIGKAYGLRRQHIQSDLGGFLPLAEHKTRVAPQGGSMDRRL